MSEYYNWKNSIRDDELKQVADIIKHDGIVVFPTETVYGIGGNALSKDVVRKIYNIKKRPHEKALTILVKDKNEIEKYGVISNDLERKIINEFMPGPITIILKKKNSSIGNLLTANNDTIGIRIPDNNIVKSILEECNLPLAAPSANISGKPSLVKLEDIIEEFDGKVDALIDGGVCKESISSTIVKVIDGEIKILREGSISSDDIEKKII